MSLKEVLNIYYKITESLMDKIYEEPREKYS